MIVSYRDKRTETFAAGRRVPAFSGIEPATRLKLDRLEAATSLEDLAALPGNRFKALRETARASTASASTPNGGYASSGRGCPQGRPVSRLSIIIRGTVMAIRAIHPGAHLAEELKELKMSAAALARKIEVPTNRVTAILNGQRAVTADTALRLAHFFGTSPEFWLNLQQRYELRLAEQRAGKDIKTLPTLTLPPTLFADS